MEAIGLRGDPPDMRFARDSSRLDMSLTFTLSFARYAIATVGHDEALRREDPMVALELTFLLLGVLALAGLASGRLTG